MPGRSGVQINVDAVIGFGTGQFVPRNQPSAFRISHFASHSPALSIYFRQDYGPQSFQCPADVGPFFCERIGAWPDRKSSDYPEPGELQLPRMSPAQGEM